MKFLFLIFVGFVFLKATYAEEQVSKHHNIHNVTAIYNDEEHKGQSEKRQVKKTCQLAICSRIYRPVCGLVNGIPLTAPTMCHFKEKLRCLQEILEEGEEMPTFEILHEGACKENDTNILKEIKIQQRPAQKKKKPNRRRPNFQRNRNF